MERPNRPRTSGDGNDNPSPPASPPATPTPTDTPDKTERVKTETTTSEFTAMEDIPEDQEFKYDPPKKDDTLPDLYRLMETLEGGEGDLTTEDKQPQSLFNRPEHVPTYKKISELRMKIEDEEMDPYLEKFDEGVRDDVVMLGSIALEDVQEEEKHLRDEHVQYLEQEADREKDRKKRIIKKEEEAKQRVAKYLKEKRAEIARREEILRQKEKLLMDRLHQSFRRAESQLISVLENRKGEVKTFYGDLMMSEGQYGGSRGRRWKVDWTNTPQPVQIKLKCLRGVKDKLPGGRYVLMVTLYDRLGGHILRWSKLKGQHWGGATLPVNHDGNFYNLEMKLDQSMFTVLPPKPFVKPGMIIAFELFLLRGAVVQTDRVVGWGCFPICDAQFDVIEGKYKCPFLRGEMDPYIDTHEKTEELISGDLDHWLCNMYFEIVRLPRYLGGHKEYEVELEFSSALTAYPDRRNTGGEEYRDGEAPVLGSQSDLGSEGEQNGSRLSLRSDLFSPTNPSQTARSVATVTKVNLDRKVKDRSNTATMYGSRRLHKDKKLDLMLMEDSDSDDSEPEDIKAIRGEEDFRPVKNMPGMYYKSYKSNPVDLYQEKLFSMLPKTAITEPVKQKKKLTHIEELEQHSIAVQPPLAEMGRMSQKTNEKLQYVGRQFLSELGLSQWRSREFWGMVLMLIVVFFLRIFIHYCGQWLFLQAINIPVNKFNFLPYTVELNYQATLLSALQETAVVFLGPLLVLLVFSALVFLSWLSQRIFGYFPDFLSKFVLGFGVMTILNPLLILTVDSCLKRYEDESTTPTADFMKLWYHFERYEGTGIAGIFITSFLYVFIVFMSASVLYMYFLRLHNNGRLLDVFWRLHGKEENFFIPYDLELSNQELNFIVKKAERWRGEEGERRKVAVYDYIWEEEPLDDSVWNENTLDEEDQRKRETFREVTTHVSIHIIHLDGLRELYRQFLRLPDGAVVEVFGDMTVPGMDKDIKAALEKGAKGMEKLMGSSGDLHRVRGRETVMTRSGFRADERRSSAASLDSTSSGASSLPEKKKMK